MNRDLFLKIKKHNIKKIIRVCEEYLKSDDAKIHRNSRISRERLLDKLKRDLKQYENDVLQGDHLKWFEHLKVRDITRNSYSNIIGMVGY